MCAENIRIFFITEVLIFSYRIFHASNIQSEYFRFELLKSIHMTGLFPFILSIYFLLEAGCPYFLIKN